MAHKFQVKLSGDWKDYAVDEDKILKRAYLAGFPNARYKLRGQSYEIDFKNMKQKNQASGKDREIRPPFRWKPPAAPIVPKGPTTCITVPEGAAGTTIQVPHPRSRGCFISVDVPATAKAGQAMLVPVPAADLAGATPPPSPEPAAVPVSATQALMEPAKEKSGGSYTTGAKVAMGAGVAAVGGLAVAGAILGEHIAEEGWDATMADLGDTAAAAGEAIGDTAGDAGDAIAAGAEDAVDWAGDAADAAGDFIMDLF